MRGWAWGWAGEGIPGRACRREGLALNEQGTELKPTTPAGLFCGSLDVISEHSANSGNQGDSVEPGDSSSCFSNICAAQAWAEGSREGPEIGLAALAPGPTKAPLCRAQSPSTPALPGHMGERGRLLHNHAQWEPRWKNEGTMLCHKRNPNLNLNSIRLSPPPSCV